VLTVRTLHDDVVAHMVSVPFLLAADRGDSLYLPLLPR
jgi:hypothetical protein